MTPMNRLQIVQSLVGLDLDDVLLKLGGETVMMSLCLQTQLQKVHCAGGTERRGVSLIGLKLKLAAGCAICRCLLLRFSLHCQVGTTVRKPN